MYKLWATIKKDCYILLRDKVGLSLMFLMPVVLALVITTVQNSTFELVNDKKVPILVLNEDKGEAGAVLENTLQNGGTFILKKVTQGGDIQLKARMQQKEALLGLVIPPHYTEDVLQKAAHVSAQALGVVGMSDETNEQAHKPSPITLYYHPVLQSSFRQGINGALHSVLQIVQSKYIVRQLYSSINDSAALPASLEQQIVGNETPINQYSVSNDGGMSVPNATQHNIPAWTVFAMFFIVISLGSSIVQEKNSGSFLRLRTMPTPLWMSLVAKQVTYITITILQAMLIFALGKWFFPVLGLPALDFPADKAGLMLIIFLCGWCAASFAICVGVYARTQEQCNGVGAIAIVLFAAIGGLLVPAFAMPQSMQLIMRVSPLHWCLEAFYGLFLEGGNFGYTFGRVVPILIMIALFQLAAIWGMRRKGFV
ncbi:MAG: ABC transporter permease [Niabella sp.]